MRARDLTEDANAAAALPWREPGLEPRKDRVALFRSRALELLTRSHPAMPYLVVLPIAIACAVSSLLAGSSRRALLGLFALGWLAWTLVEYLMHRFVFHARARSETGRIAALLAHGHHHVWPDDPRRIAASPIQIGSLALLFFGVFRATLAPGDHLAAFSGTLVGYVAYEAVHWIAHHGRPSSRLFCALRDHHLKHHHIAPASRWGISSPLWDWVFRTHR